MEILVKGLPSGYEVEHLVRLFYPRAPLRTTASTRGPLVYARAGRVLWAGLRRPGGVVSLARRAIEAEGPPLKTQLCRLVYDLLRRETGLRPPWGMLTGVRPVQLLRKTLRGGGQAQAKAHLQGLYDVSDTKYALIEGIYNLQAPHLAQNRPQSYSLYASIPFCPSRCAYCSFVSRTIEREGHLVGAYLQRLDEELTAIAAAAGRLGLRLETVYVGGGTPTALDEAGLEALLQSLHRHFAIGAAREFTVEAGRPDCTSPEKLRLLKQYGVTRISINPQTLDDGVLQNIGRRHTAADVLRCYAAARAAGHENINMDLIAGLPGDTLEGFTASLQGVLALEPENITVHTLTLKRSSDLILQPESAVSLPAGMLAAAYPLLAGAGYVPYYLYRQKNTVDNLENTGWTKPGREGLYNIHIMEESHTILAAGAGASTKLVGQGGGKIQRVYNYKFPSEYIQQFGQLMLRKKGVEEFYAGHLDTQAPGGNRAD